MRSLSGVIFLLFVVGIVLLSSYATGISGEDGSDFREATSAEYSAELTEALNIAYTYSIEDALSHVYATTTSRVPYGMVHMILHEVGHQAYAVADGDLGTAFSYIPTFAQDPAFRARYDGYTHGLFHSLFVEQKDVLDTQSIILRACGSYLSFAERPSDKPLSFDCFHGIGHALMYSGENDIHASVTTCKTLPYEWMKDACYYGSFMELMYLHWPAYNTIGPRLHTADSPIFSVCDDFSGNAQVRCAHFAGEAYFFNSGGDLSGALNRCEQFESHTLQRSCVSRVAGSDIPVVYREDIRGMIRACESIQKHLQRECGDALLAGVAQGAGGNEKAQQVEDLTILIAEKLES